VNRIQGARAKVRADDLGFAGRYPASHPVHRAIERLATGDGIELRHGERKWEFWHEGDVVGRLAGAFTPRAEMRCMRGTVAAVLTRLAEDSTPEPSRKTGTATRLPSPTIWPKAFDPEGLGRCRLRGRDEGLTAFPDQVAHLIVVIRGQRVIIDSALAILCSLEITVCDLK
jgi:hypothetical protein